MKQRIVFLALAFCLMLSLIPVLSVPALAASGTCGKNLTWKLEGQTLILSGSGAMTEFEDVFDEDINYAGTTAPWYGMDYTEILLPTGLTTIGYGAFADSAALVRVTIPNGVTSIGSYAFSNCPLLEEVNLPTGLRTLGGSVFENCVSLTGPLVIPGGVQTINGHTFSNCRNLADVTLSEGLVHISTAAFQNTAISRIDIPASVQRISDGVFSDCKNLSGVWVDPSSKYLVSDSKGVCYTKDRSEVIHIPASFEGTFTLPAAAVKLREYSLQGCTRLTKIVLHANAELVLWNYYENCPALTAVEVAAGNPYMTSVNGVLYNKNRTALICCPAGTQSGNFSVPAGVTAIGADAFSNCARISKITLPASVRTIEPGVFDGCDSLTAFSVDSGNAVFMSRDALLLRKACTIDDITYSSGTVLSFFPSGITGEYTFPDGLKRIDDEACSTSRLTKAILPESLRSLGQFSFRDCADLKQLRFLGDPPEVGYAAFHNVTAEIIYPAGSLAWSDPEADFWYGFGDLTFRDDTPPAPPEPIIPGTGPFDDVPITAYYSDAVLWAWENGITNGVTSNSFAPEDLCSRAHVVTFLWRAFGCPDPVCTEHPFTDVPAGEYYYNAMLWALENGITTGMDEYHFAPDEVCSRSQVVTFLHRAAGFPEPALSEHSFTDTDPQGYYHEAVLWAIENGITNGTSATTFSPDDPCTRGQVVTFLHRFCG